MSQRDYKKILDSLSLDEKLSLLSGKTFWLTQDIEAAGIPSVWMSDGPHGLRKEKQSAGTNIMQASETSTCFPTAVTTASSWDPELMTEVGATIADEAKALKVTTVLGPGVNIKRSPLCGRNFEYISEDPFLTARMGAAYVHGVQEQGIGVSLKHYCANNEEHIRMCIDTVADERAMREIYLPAFEHIVKTEQPTTVMCSYNKIEGDYLSENKRYLTDILRGEWGFKGIVVSDWGAVNNRVKGIKAGLDLEMPGNKGMNNNNIKRALESGELSMQEVDECVLRMIRFAFECKENEGDGYDIDFEAHHKIAKKAAISSAVLMKNEEKALPLQKHNSIAVIGALAKKLRYQGAGSSHINAYKTVSFVEALERRGQAFTYADGYSLKGDGYNKKLIAQACEAAKRKDAVIVFIGLTDAFESEGFDRKHINMPASHGILIDELYKVNKNIIVVLSCGSPVQMKPWDSKAKAILNMYLAGQAGGEACYELIFGKANPSGKLAETFPLINEDNLSAQYFPMGPRTVEYRESIFVGYRYFDTAKKAVAYPFGHGLSYTDFSYSNLKLSKKSIKEGEKLTISVDIKNTGTVAGAEVVQIYVASPESKIFKAEKELKGFRKVYLQAKQTATVEIELDERAFSYYNINICDFHAESGEYRILAGSSSRDIRLEDTVTVKSARKDVQVPDYSESAPSYYNMEETAYIPDEEFVALLGRELPNNEEYKKGELTINCSVSQVAVSPFGKALYGLLTNGAKLVALSAENPDMITESIKDMPLRSFSGFTGGLLSQMSVDGILELCNGVKGGGKKVVAGFRKKNK